MRVGSGLAFLLLMGIKSNILNIVLKEDSRFGFDTLAIRDTNPIRAFSKTKSDPIFFQNQDPAGSGLLCILQVFSCRLKKSNLVTLFYCLSKE